jgi:uncharacterized protein (DUF362 family)
MSLSRRDLLNRLGFGLTFLPALAMTPRPVMRSILFEPDAPLAPAKPLPPNPFTRDGKSLVALVRGEEPAAMLAQGLALIGGIDRLSVHGKRVMLKPNIVNAKPPPSTTSPAIVAATVRAMLDAGATDVVVADSSGMTRFPTRENLVATGIQAAAESAGGRVMALEDEPWVRIEPAGAEVLRQFYVSKPVYEAPVFINLPVVKTHRFAHYSCSLKNLVGIAHPRNRPSLAFLAGSWHERIAELNLAVHPQLTVADATTIMIAGGPSSGTPARADLLLLSGDRIALDAVAVALLRSYESWPKVMDKGVWEQRQIRRAIELGLGARGPNQVELVTASVAGTDARFERLVERIRRDVGLA